MKTKQIIKELRRCGCLFDEDIVELHVEAANRLEMLSAELKKLHGKLEAMKAQRNALREHLREVAACDACRHEEVPCYEPPCSECKMTGGLNNKWEWRGAKDTNVPSKTATDTNVGTKEE